MLRLLMLAAVVVVTGCPDGAAVLACERDADCPVGTCRERACVAPDVEGPGNGEGEGEGVVAEGEGEPPLGEGEGEGAGGEGEGEGAGGEGEGEGAGGEGEGEGEGEGPIVTVVVEPAVILQNSTFQLTWAASDPEATCVVTVDGASSNVGATGSLSPTTLAADIVVDVVCGGTRETVTIVPVPRPDIAQAWPPEFQSGEQARIFRIDLRVRSGAGVADEQTLTHGIDLDATLASFGLAANIAPASVAVFNDVGEPLITFVVDGIDGRPVLCFESTPLDANQDRTFALYVDEGDFFPPPSWTLNPVNVVAGTFFGSVSLSSTLGLEDESGDFELGGFGWRVSGPTAPAATAGVFFDQTTAAFVAATGPRSPSLGDVTVVDTVVTSPGAKVQQVLTRHASGTSMRSHVLVGREAAGSELSLYVDIDLVAAGDDDVTANRDGAAFVNVPSGLDIAVGLAARPPPRLVFVDDTANARKAWDTEVLDHDGQFSVDTTPGQESDSDAAAVFIWDVPDGGLEIDLVLVGGDFASAAATADVTSKAQSLADVTVVDGLVWRFVP